MPGRSWRWGDGHDQHPVGHRGAVLDGAGADPVVGITNWLLIPFAAIGAIIAAIGLVFTRSERNGRAKAGLVLNALVIVVATWRLGLGGGLL